MTPKRLRTDPRIRWNTQEEEVLKAHFTELLGDMTSLNVPLVDLVRKAQLALPPDRRRQIPFTSMLRTELQRWLRRAYDDRKHQIRKGLTTKPKPAPEPEAVISAEELDQVLESTAVTEGMVERDDDPETLSQAEADEIAHRRAQVMNRNEPVLWAPVSFTFQRLEASLREAARGMAEILTDMVMQEVQEQVEQRVTAVVRNEAAKLKKPKVLVVGPKADQQQILAREFGDMLNLRFVSSERTRDAADLAKTHPHVLVWTNFVDHGTTQHIPNKTLVTGGMSALSDALTKLAVEH